MILNSYTLSHTLQACMHLGFDSCSAVILSVMHWQSIEGLDLVCPACLWDVTLLHTAYSALYSKCKSIHSLYRSQMADKWGIIQARDKEKTVNEDSYNNKCYVVRLFSTVVFTHAWSSRGNLGRGREKLRQSTERPKLANSCQEAACLLQC